MQEAGQTHICLAKLADYFRSTLIFLTGRDQGRS